MLRWCVLDNLDANECHECCVSHCLLRDPGGVYEHSENDTGAAHSDRQREPYKSRRDPESYRNLGIGIKSIKEAGPLARSVISYLKDNVR